MLNHNESEYNQWPREAKSTVPKILARLGYALVAIWIIVGAFVFFLRFSSFVYNERKGTQSGSIQRIIDRVNNPQSAL